MARATVTAEIEAEVSFMANSDSDDPREVFFDNMELESLWMFGNEWTEKELRLTFGDMGANAMLQLIFNNVEDWDYE